MLPTIPVRDGRAPIDTSNPHALPYAVASAAGRRALYAREDRATTARVRAHWRDYDGIAMRTTLGASVGCGWGSFSTRAIDGIPDGGRAFGPPVAHEQIRHEQDADGRRVDSFYRAIVLGAAAHRIRERAQRAHATGAAVGDVLRMLDEEHAAHTAAHAQAAHANHGRTLAGAIQ